MTLENATQNLWKAHCNFYDPRKAMNIVIDKIFNDHEAQLKQAYINGSNSTNELIQSLYKQIEQLKDNQCY